MTTLQSVAQDFDVAIVGAGPAGLAAGLSAAALGLDAAVIGPRADSRDGRTAALFQPSVALLKNLDAWDRLAGRVEPLDAIRLVDATGSLFRAPEVTFRASEIDLDAFGYNVPNAALTQALEAANVGRVTRIDAIAESVAIETDQIRIAAGGTTIRARLVGAADGRASPTRAAAGIATTSWTYDQAALVTTFAHSRPHHRVSTEFHRRAGPLTVVPGPGDTSSLVWVETPGEAQWLADLHETAFAAELRTHIGGLLGTLSDVEPRRVFPLSGQTATSLAQNRVALIGEAAHVMPPIGAQGLNLSFRDAATLATLAADAKRTGGDCGSDAVLAAYAAGRARDVQSRVAGVDLLNRSLLSELLPVHFARGLGLYALASVPALRRAAMRAGVAASELPPLMQDAPKSPELEPRASVALDAPAARQA
ncbi:MAG: FAD-dependent monooxygenase [Hyphomicrobium sp.]